MQRALATIAEDKSAEARLVGTLDLYLAKFRCWNSFHEGTLNDFHSSLPGMGGTNSPTSIGGCVVSEDFWHGAGESK